MFLVTRKREIKRARVHRAYENTTFGMFIRNNLSVQNKFISIY